MIKALPSYWRGVEFRSRTEARWAVFFDYMNVRWEYETEGFLLDDGSLYLPDFWLPDMEKWVEVKPRGRPLEEEVQKVELLAKGSGFAVALLCGQPACAPFRLCWWSRKDPTSGPSWDWVFFTEKYLGRFPHDGRPRFWHSYTQDAEPLGGRVCEDEYDDDFVKEAAARALTTDVRSMNAGVGAVCEILYDELPLPF